MNQNQHNMNSKIVFEQQGYAIINDLVRSQPMETIKAQLTETNLTHQAGYRELLAEEWCQQLVRQLKNNRVIKALFVDEMVAIQCTFFSKSVDKNWLVPIHQDLSIPVKEKFSQESFAGWSIKQNILFVQPPATMMTQLIALRLHLDDCQNDHGPLRVVSCSHLAGRLSLEDQLLMRQKYSESLCLVKAGDAVLMRPLLLHASSKATQPNQRRVLHFLFAPAALNLPFAFRV